MWLSTFETLAFGPFVVEFHRGDITKIPFLSSFFKEYLHALEFPCMESSISREV
jgi:hypothetical protein